MNIQSIIILVLIIFCFVLAIRYMIKNNDHCVGCNACKNKACSKCSASCA